MSLSHSNKDYDKVRKARNILEYPELRLILFLLRCLNDDEIDEFVIYNKNYQYEFT